MEWETAAGSDGIHLKADVNVQIASDVLYEGLISCSNLSNDYNWLVIAVMLTSGVNLLVQVSRSCWVTSDSRSDVITGSGPRITTGVNTRQAESLRVNSGGR